jgi:3-phytase
VRGDADDCAIWVSPDDPARALVIGTDKSAKAAPGLYVWDLDGRERQFLPVPRPNNVDLRAGVRLAGARVDLVVCNARGTREMRVFRVDRERATLADVTTPGGIRTPELGDPYGLCLYVRPRDGALFAIASTQEGDTGYLHQYRLEDDGRGGVRGRHVRRFGGDIAGYVEGLVADDELGWVYASDEDHAVRKYHADPDSSGAPLAAFAPADEVVGDREGLAIYDCGGGRGWLVLSSQGDGSIKVYRREGELGEPHRHPLVATFATRGAKDTDGLDVSNRVRSPRFPAGLLVKHDSRGRNFLLYSWADALPCGP